MFIGRQLFVDVVLASSVMALAARAGPAQAIVIANTSLVYPAAPTPVRRAMIAVREAASLPSGGRREHRLNNLRISIAKWAYPTKYENEQPDPTRLGGQVVDTADRLEGAYDDSIFAVLVHNGMFFDPTLVGYETSIVRAAPELAARGRLISAEELARLRAGDVVPK